VRGLVGQVAQHALGQAQFLVRQAAGQALSGALGDQASDVVNPLSGAGAQACTMAVSRGQSDHRRNRHGAVDHSTIAAGGTRDV